MALMCGVTWDVPGLSARALGVIGIVVNYQMLYGTVLYFSNYCYNRRGGCRLTQGWPRVDPRLTPGSPQVDPRFTTG